MKGRIDLICTFFGHRDTPDIVKPLLREVLLDLIENQGVKQFYVGDQGNFDAMVRNLLAELERSHRILYDVVLAYLPKKADPFFEAYYTILPEGIETVPPRFAIDYRNKWLIGRSDIVVTYVTHVTGGAAKYKAIAIKRQKKVVELSDNICEAIISPNDHLFSLIL